MIPVQNSKFPPGWIIVPTGILPRFIEFWDALDLLRVPEGTGRSRNSGPDCDSNRNRGIRVVLAGTEAQWVLFLDDDQEFDSYTLMDMLERMYTLDLPVLTKLYVRKTPPFQPVLFEDADAPAQTRINYTKLTELRKENEVQQIGACGGGCLLVRRNVLEQLTDPWFNPGPGRSYGGDIGFCRKLKAAGIPLHAWLAPVGHNMPSTITPRWNEAEQRWQIEFLFGGKGFLLDFTERVNEQ